MEMIFECKDMSDGTTCDGSLESSLEAQIFLQAIQFNDGLTYSEFRFQQVVDHFYDIFITWLEKEHNIIDLRLTMRVVKEYRDVCRGHIEEGLRYRVKIWNG